MSYSVQLAPGLLSDCPVSSQQRRESAVRYYIGCSFRVRGHDALALHAGMRWSVERAAVIRPPPSFGLCGVSVLLAGLSALEPIAGRAGMRGGDLIDVCPVHLSRRALQARNHAEVGTSSVVACSETCAVEKGWWAGHARWTSRTIPPTEEVDTVRLFLSIANQAR